MKPNETASPPPAAHCGNTELKVNIRASVREVTFIKGVIRLFCDPAEETQRRLINSDHLQLRMDCKTGDCYVLPDWEPKHDHN